MTLMILMLNDKIKGKDIYDISPNYITMASPAITILLIVIFERSIMEGVFPDKMKTAKVIPLHNGYSALLVSTYRLISLLPIFSRIFESFMFNRLTEFIRAS